MTIPGIFPAKALTASAVGILNSPTRIPIRDPMESPMFSAVSTTSTGRLSITLDHFFENATNSTVIKFAKIVSSDRELVVKPTLAGGEVSILGTDIGAKIYGDCDLVLFTDTSTVVAPVNIITKKIKKASKRINHRKIK